MSQSQITQQVLSNCGKCGLCLSSCPVYQVLKEEQASPRARLQLIKAFENNTLESSGLLKEIISKCLMCGACAVTCPSGINHYERFMAMRQKMVEDLGETPAIRSLIFLLSKEYRLKAGAKLAGMGQRLTPQSLADKYKLGNIPVNKFPKLNKTPFRSVLPETISHATKGAPKGKVLYFTGCATNYMFEDTGKATVEILRFLGYEVTIPSDQTCCAIPLLFHGAAKQARTNIQTNIKTLAAHSFDWIIVDCTTCGAALKDEYPAFIKRQIETSNDDTKVWQALENPAKQISGKTRDILGFLADHDLSYQSEPQQMGKAVYHAPCHSRNGFNTHGSVQKLLTGLPGIEYIPTPQEADCCGGGGTFFYEHPDIAKKMMDKKQEQISTTGADLWLTDCPVCRINLAGNLKKSDSTRVCHPVSPIYSALNKETS